MENTICHFKHNIFHLSNRTNRNSTCWVVNKIFHSPNRTNRPNRQACKGSLSLMRCNFRMENTICQIEHNIFHSLNRTNRNSTCQVVNKIFHSPNRTNRLNRQICKGSLSIMRCNCWIENSTCQIVQKFLYSPNRTNRSNRTSVFSDRIQLTDWVLDMDGCQTGGGNNSNRLLTVNKNWTLNLLLFAKNFSQITFLFAILED